LELKKLEQLLWSELLQMPEPTDRRVIHWKKLRSPKIFGAFACATALGAGLSPIAPGTMGSLVSLPLIYALSNASDILKLAIWVGLFVLGTWASKVMDESMGSSDNQNIVIDEVVGMGITAWTAGENALTLGAAFLIFRFFDVIKPPPVRQIDSWSKIQASKRQGALSAWWGGFGVMADDLFAGVQGLLVIVVLQRLGILP
jgi:phosphatidylglycerophosphatase A